MINFVQWGRACRLSDDAKKMEVIRFIVKNINLNDIVIFNDISKYCVANKRSFIEHIRHQCGTSSLCPFDEIELQEIENSIFHNCKEVDMESLISKNPTNIILFSYDEFPNKFLNSVICNFATKCNILGISEYDYPELVSIVTRIKDLQYQGLNSGQIRIIMNLENKYSPLAIQNALTSLYYKNDCSIKTIPVLDAISPLWKNK